MKSARTLEVVFHDRDEPERAYIQNAALVRWDITRMKHEWPSAVDAPFLFNTFVAWQSMCNAGTYSGDWDEFQDAVATVLPVEEEGATDLVPTRPGPEPGSA